MGGYLMQKHRALPAYVPGEHAEDDSFIRLNTNESPYPPSPSVAAAVAREVGQLSYYNDPDCTALRAALAGLYGVQPENVAVGNGSDELLAFAFYAFADADHPIALPDITYGYYDLFAAVYGIPLRRIPLKDDFTVDVDAFCGAGCMIVLTNPNAPTGYAISVDQIERIVRSNPQSVVLVDEAYIDFGAESCLPLIGKYDNLLIVRTYSKSRSMAGARIGYCFGCADLIAQLEVIRNALNLYSVSRMAQAAGEAAVAENDYYMDNCRRIMDTRRMTTDALREMGFEVLESLGNFIFARCPQMAGAQLAAALRQRGILVRRWDAPRISEYLRITIGTREQMETMLEAISAILV
ncbi:MAG: histidinol-phosphate transaminase [Clostridia bacterium]|nr:histidinol-phosphate transaminase [Clostridia bacterium]